MSESTLWRSENEITQHILGVLLKRIEALYDQIGKLWESKNGVQEEAISGLEKNVQSIKETIVYYQDEIKPFGDSTPTTKEETSLKNEASQIKNRDLQGKIHSLEGRVIELEKKVIELEEEKKKLENGQVAFEFEKAMAMFILPEHKQIGDVDVYNRTKAWVKKEKKKNTEEGEDANKKLHYIMTKWQLSNEHDKLIKMLKNERKGPAHPSMSLKISRFPNISMKHKRNVLKILLRLLNS